MGVDAWCLGLAIPHDSAARTEPISRPRTKLTHPLSPALFPSFPPSLRSAVGSSARESSTLQALQSSTKTSSIGEQIRASTRVTRTTMWMSLVRFLSSLLKPCSLLCAGEGLTD